MQVTKESAGCISETWLTPSYVCVCVTRLALSLDVRLLSAMREVSGGADVPLVALSVEPEVFGQSILNVLVSKECITTYFGRKFSDRAKDFSRSSPVSVPLLPNHTTLHAANPRSQRNLSFPPSPAQIDAAQLSTTPPRSVPLTLWNDLIDMLRNVDLEMTNLHLKYIVSHTHSYRQAHSHIQSRSIHWLRLSHWTENVWLHAAPNLETLMTTNFGAQWSDHTSTNLRSRHK